MALSKNLQYEIVANERYLGATLFGVQREKGSIASSQRLEETENDPHVRAVLEKRSRAVSNKAVEVLAVREAIARDRNEKIPDLSYAEKKGRDIVANVLGRINYQDARYWLMRSRFSGVESVLVEKWDEVSGLILPYFKPLDYQFLGFRKPKPEEVENISMYGGYGITCGYMGAQKFIPAKYAIALSYGNTSNPWGWGLAETIYWLSNIRREMLKYGLVFADRYATPPVVAETEQGETISSDNLEKVESFLDNLTQESWCVLPPGFKAKVLSSTGNTGDYYQSVYNSLGLEISRLVLGETGTTDQSGSGGSRARDEVAADQQSELLKADAADLDDAFNRTLVKWIVDLNGGGEYPVIRTIWPKNEAGILANEKTKAETLSLQIANYNTLNQLGFQPQEKEAVFDGWTKVAPILEEGEQASEIDESKKALAGVQTEAILTNVINAMQGTIPVDTAKAIIQVSLPAVPEQAIDAILDPVRAYLSGSAKQVQTIDTEAEEFAALPIEERYAQVDTSPPDTALEVIQDAIEVRNQARYGDQAGDYHYQVGRRLLSEIPLTAEDARKLTDWFDRAERTKSTKAWGKKGKSWQAWHLRGGDAGREWVRSLSSQFDAADRGEMPNAEVDQFAADTDSEPLDELQGSIADDGNQVIGGWVDEVEAELNKPGDLKSFRAYLDERAITNVDPLGLLLGGAMSATDIMGRGEAVDSANGNTLQ